MPDGERHGVLHWEPTATGKRLKLHDSAGPIRTVTHPEKFLDADLRARPEEALEGVEVDYVWGGGQTKRIREKGKPWREPSPPATTTGPEPWRGSPLAATRGDTVDAFANPYTFVPAPPRDTQDPELGDHAPAGHDRLRDDLWTGRISVNLEVATPLLLLDTAAARPHPAAPEHSVYPLKMVNGQPHLAPTAIKGMLRSAYEAVTNSRFGVFTDHKGRLAMRASASDGLRAIPARVVGGHLVLLPGTTPIGAQGTANSVLHAAWVPRWRRHQPDVVKGRLGHGAEIEAWVEKVHHAGPPFDFWQVTELAAAGTGQLSRNPTLLPRPRRDQDLRYVPTGRTLRIDQGWLSLTNQTFSRKHDERVFFSMAEAPPPIPITEDMRRLWRDVIGSYRAAHTYDEIHRRRDGADFAPPQKYLGREPGKTAWSPHLYDARWDDLSEDLLLYVTLDHDQVQHLSPVMIGRRPYGASPEELLHPSLQPAGQLEQLSPADRVFGWVGAKAHRGQLRVGPVTATVVTTRQFLPPLPLAILGEPKPQQARFYAAGDTRGTPLPRGIEKGSMYRSGQGLRGRKVYLHHAGLPEVYWDPPTPDRDASAGHGGPDGTQELLGDRYREYLRPREATDEQAPRLTPDNTSFVTKGEQRDNQNRSIDGWVEPGSTFTFDLDVTNLSDVELGALLWLLSLDPSCHHRLGLGKPLGFGSVTMRVENLELAPGQVWRRRWALQAPPVGSADPWSTIDRFKAAVAKDGTFAETAYIRVFLDAARGDPRLRVHYPRARPSGMSKVVPPPPDPRGHGFDWFVLNERTGRGTITNGRSLPAAGEPPLQVYDVEDRRR